MLRITLSFDGATWADLRKYVALNHAAPDGDPLRFDYDEILGDDAPVGLSEAIPAEEVLPRGE